MTAIRSLTVTYEGPTRFVANDRVRKPLRFVVEPGEDLPVGAQLRWVMGCFRSMHDNNAERAEQWRRFQAGVEGGGADEAIKVVAGTPNDFFALKEAGLHGELANHYTVGVVEVAEPVPAGAKLVMRLEAVLSHQAPLDARTFVQAKLPDDEDFHTVGEVIALQNVPGPASGIEARAKSAPANGVHAIHVLTHDDIDNPVDALPVAELDTEALGAGEATGDGVKPTGDQPVRVRVRQPETGYESLTNPVQRGEFNGRRVYFGGIHWHSRFSGDGDRPLEQGYAYARDTLGLDFAGVTDHTPKGFWQQTLEINEQFHEPGRFVVLPAWEWSTSTGHSNIYLRRPDAPAGPELADTADHPGNADWPDEALVIPHHTNIRSTVRKPDGSHFWHEFNWSLPNHRVRLVELLQTRGNFEADQLDHDWGVVTGGIGASVRDALAMGYRIGFVGGTDNHTAFPTRNAQMGGGYIGMACVLADALTRESIWDAMNARRTYATSGKSILCHWTVNGHEMGEEGKLEGKTVTFSAALHGTAPIERVEVISGGEIVWRSHPDAFDVTLTDEALPAPPAGSGNSAYYYLRLRQHDGHRAWLSPVWLDR